jgi:hypothetical protein
MRLPTIPKRAKEPSLNSDDMIPYTLTRPGAARFWLALLLTGAGTGVAAAALTRLLEMVQHVMWKGSSTDLLAAALNTGINHWRRAGYPETTVQR